MQFQNAAHTNSTYLSSFVYQVISSYLLRPLAFIMGIPWQDSDVVAELLGIKTFLNEFVAYTKLAEYIRNRELGNGMRTISVSCIVMCKTLER